MMACDAFLPDPARAAVIDRTVRMALIESLDTIFKACAGSLAWQVADQNALLAALRSHAVSPAIYGIYTELVEALLAEDTRIAQERLEMLLQPQLRAWTVPGIVTLDEVCLGKGLPALYARTIDDDADVPLRIAAVDGAERARCDVLFDHTVTLLGKAAPALLGEIETMAAQVVAVRDAGPVGAFGGASTFCLWGAIILNSARHRTRPQMAEALAHEAAHSYLLGSTLGVPLVVNDPAERYRSPLRADARPMDGLVHASFVLARIIWCHDQLLQSGLLDEKERDDTIRAWNAGRDRFLDSRALIEAQARFMSNGETLWTAARNWVRIAD
jgi:HEXXH motif-containing protein